MENPWKIYGKFFLLFFLTLILSCGAKKKATERGSEKIWSVESTGLKQLSVESNIETAQIARVQTKNTVKKGIRTTLKATGNGPITYTDKDKTFTVSGADIILEEYEINQKIKDSTTSDSSSKSEKTDSIEINQKKESSLEKSWRNVKTFILRIPVWFWFFLIIVLVLYFLWRHYFR